MKSIIIVGVGRNGKTTLARKINEELNYFVINLDKLMTVFERAYPQLDVRIAWDYYEATENVTPFLGHFFGIISSNEGFAGYLNLRRHAAPGSRFVLEGGHFSFDKIAEIFETYGNGGLKDNYTLVGLVQMNKTEEDFFRDLRKYDTEDDWTHGLDDEELLGLCGHLVKDNQFMYDKFIEHGFNIYDTGVERERVFEKIIYDIKSGAI